MIVSGHTDIQTVSLLPLVSIVEGIALRAFCGVLEKDLFPLLFLPWFPWFPSAYLAPFLLTQLMQPSTWSSWSRCRNRWPGVHIRPPNAIQTRYSHNAGLHCHKLSGRVTHHDVTDGGTFMCKCTVVTRDWWWCVIFFSCLWCNNRQWIGPGYCHSGLMFM